MKRWLKYFAERSPFAVFGIVSVGGGLSGQFLGGSRIAIVPLVVAALGFLAFGIEARMMDELKDYEKDLVAHPKRPLPRGLLKVSEVQAGVVWVFMGMLALAGLTAFLTNATAGVLFAISSGYLWLMYKEFYIGSRLATMPMAYAVTHQLVLFPLYSFLIATAHPAIAIGRLGFAYGLANIGAGMTFEICRKLDPDAAPVLGYYRTVYGLPKTLVFATVAILAGAVGAYLLGLQKLLWPMEGLVLLSLVVVALNPKKFKVVEGVAMLSTLVHLLSVTIAHYAGWPR